MIRLNARSFRAIGVAAATAAIALVAGAATSTSASARTPALAGAAATAASGTLRTFATPFRTLDTRTSGTRRAWAAKSTHTVPRASGVPTTGVSGVVINLTAVTPSANGYLTAYPGGTRPTISSLNYLSGKNRANLVTVPVASDGSFKIYTYAKSHVLVDVIGWYSSATSTGTAGSTYYPDEPHRILDTRTGTKMPRNSYTHMYVNYGATDNPSLRAFAFTVTVLQPTTKGFMTVWSGASSTIPTTSTLNWNASRDTSAMAIVPASRTTTGSYPNIPRFAFYNSDHGAVHVLIDLVGAYFQDPSGLRFVPLTPRRVVDTRSNLGSTGNYGTATETVTFDGMSTYTAAVVTNTTTVRPSVKTWLTTWIGDNADAVPDVRTGGTGNPGETNAIAAMTSTGCTDTCTTQGFYARNHAGTSDVLIDIMGRMDFDPVLGARRTARHAISGTPGDWQRAR